MVKLRSFRTIEGRGGRIVNALTLEIIGRCSKGDKTSTENAKAREKG